jgi:DnaJ domain
MRNPYEVLGVTILSDAETIREAYEGLAARYEHAGDPAAGALFKEVRAAYELLSNEERRAAFDRDGVVDDGGADDHAPANPFALPPRPRASREPSGPPIPLIMLITSAVVLCLVIACICVVPDLMRWRPYTLFSVIGALLFSIFKFGLEWIEERAAWRD